MKKLIVAIGIFSLIVVNAETEQIVKSKIKSVTVFLQGAQVTRKGSFSTGKGTSQIIFEGISPQYNSNSIQVKGKGNFTILDVKSDLFYPQPDPQKDVETPEKIQREIRLLSDSIEAKQYSIQEIQTIKGAYEFEKNVLITSGVIKGQTGNDSIAALKDAMVYMREKLAELNKLIFSTSKKLDQLNKEYAAMNTRLSELQNWNRNTGNIQPKYLPPVNRIIVTISANESTSGLLELNYMVNNAGWTPAYDLRADDILKPVQLTYKAKVFQNTGVKWEDVKVKLSTINPNRSNVKPTLAPWYINYYRPIQQNYDNQVYENKVRVSAPVAAGMVITEDAEMDESFKTTNAGHLSNFTQMSQNMTMVEFDIAIPYTIESDGKEHLMAVANENIDATYQHYIVPKLDKDAFLVARLTGWEDMNLLPAVANIYYDGTYVGQTRINPQVMSDTLDLAMGRDQGVYLTRKKTSDEEKVNKISGKKEKEVEYTIAIKNYKSTEVNLIVEDQVPISLIEDIKVEILEEGGAEYNKKTGMLTWDLKIGTKETVKHKYSYLLKFDKDKTLALN